LVEKELHSRKQLWKKIIVHPLVICNLKEVLFSHLVASNECWIWNVFWLFLNVFGKKIFSQACYEPVCCTNCVVRSRNPYGLVLGFPQDFSCYLLINFVGTFWHVHDPCYTNNFRV
jgi:hypothetical protein